MRINATTAIEGERVVLVPYESQHVAKYHQWMLGTATSAPVLLLTFSSDPYILAMTASESLSLEEEYSMQRSWREDPDKCTFIVLSRFPEDEAEIDRMAGDVNIYLHPWDERGHAEIEVMIAEERYRCRGFAREAVTLMMQYGFQLLDIHRFYAKINKTNTPSLRLFSR